MTFKSNREGQEMLPEEAKVWSQRGRGQGKMLLIETKPRSKAQWWESAYASLEEPKHNSQVSRKSSFWGGEWEIAEEVIGVMSHKALHTSGQRKAMEGR